MQRTNISTGTEWESQVGYSRAVRVGPEIHVSGTTATNSEGEIVGENDPYEQSVQALQNIERALKQLNATLEDVVRTRMYVTDIDHWEAIGDAHSEVFSEIRPATSMIEVNRLISPELLVEFEAVAISEPPTNGGAQ